MRANSAVTMLPTAATEQVGSVPQPPIQRTKREPGAGSAFSVTRERKRARTVQSVPQFIAPRIVPTPLPILRPRTTTSILAGIVFVRGRAAEADVDVWSPSSTTVHVASLALGCRVASQSSGLNCARSPVATSFSVVDSSNLRWSQSTFQVHVTPAASVIVTFSWSPPSLMLTYNDCGENSAMTVWSSSSVRLHVGCAGQRGSLQPLKTA